MKKILLLIFILLLFVSSLSNAYVIIYPGVTFYGTDITVTVSNPSGINLSYFEVGNKYVRLGGMNLSVSDTAIINISKANSGHVLSAGTTVLRFNVTTTSIITYVFTGNMTSPTYKLYRNGTLISTQSSNSFSWYRAAGTHDFDIRVGTMCANPPTTGNSSFDAPSNTVNLTWTSSNDSDKDIVVMKTNSYPSSPSAGHIYQNSTHNYYNFTVNQTGYFAIFTYNATANAYSCTGLNIPWGAILIYAVYNESKPTQGVSPFGLQISNSAGTNVYWDDSTTAPVKISKDDIPFGTNTVITINASGYRSTRFYYDFIINHLYNLTFYIPPLRSLVENGTGDTGTNDSQITSRLYRIRVIDDSTYPIASVKVYVKRYINTTDVYENTSILLTDGYGEADVYLVPGANYKVILEKTGYKQTGSNDWIPDPVFYGANYPKVFQMSIDQDIIQNESKTFWDIITFKATMYANSSLYVEYVDSMSDTIDAQFYTYEVYNYTEYLNSTNSTTSSVFTFWVRNLNISRTHRVALHLNHTTLGWVNVSILVAPLYENKDLQDKIEDKFIDVFGKFDLGWVNFFFIFIPLICLLVLFGPAHAEIGMIGAGFYLGISSIYLKMNANLVALGFFIVAIAIIYTITKHGRMKL